MCIIKICHLAHAMKQLSLVVRKQDLVETTKAQTTVTSLRIRSVLSAFDIRSLESKTLEPVHEISNNVVCATSKASDQPAHMRSLIRAFASRLSIL